MESEIEFTKENPNLEKTIENLQTKIQIYSDLVHSFSNNNKNNNFNLPNEIWLLIFSFIPLIELFKCRFYITSKQFNSILSAENNEFWKKECIKLGLYSTINQDREDINWKNDFINWYKGESEQKLAIDLVVEKKLSIFITGEAGVGKSYVIKQIVKKFKEKNKRVGVTASTGIAAIQIGGSTLHSWCGLGLAKEDITLIIKKVKSKSPTAYSIRKKWQEIDALIIDEISLLSVEYFEKLDKVARYIYEKHYLPFGGLQVIVVGDFYQLPPVQSDLKGRSFCFQSPIWEELIKRKINLEQVHRQKDKVFIGLLNRMREEKSLLKMKNY